MDESTIGPKKLIRKFELLEVIAQALDDLHYSDLVEEGQIRPPPDMVPLPSLIIQQGLVHLLEKALTLPYVVFSYNDMSLNLYHDHTMCMESDEETIGPKKIVGKVELATIIAESLRFLGHKNIAEKLEAEAKIPTSLSRMAVFFQHVEHRDWPLSLRILERIPLGSSEIMESVCFLISKQWLVDIIEKDLLKERLGDNDLRPGYFLRLKRELVTLMNPNEESETYDILEYPIVFRALDSTYQNVSMVLPGNKVEELAVMSRLPRDDLTLHKVDILQTLEQLLQGTLLAPLGRLIYLVEHALEAHMWDW